MNHLLKNVLAGFAAGLFCGFFALQAIGLNLMPLTIPIGALCGLAAGAK